MLRALMDKPKQIRNMSVIAHVDHGASRGRRRAVLRIRSRMRLLHASCASSTRPAPPPRALRLALGGGCAS